MIRINLVPREEVRRQAARALARQTALLLGLGLAVVIGGAEIVTRTQRASVSVEVDTFREELKALNVRHQQAQLLERKRKELAAKVGTIDLLEKRRSGPARILADLSAATPERLWLTEVRSTGSSANIVGRAIDNQTIAVFMREIEASLHFAGVDLIETRQVEEGDAKFKEFQIRAELLFAAAPEVAGGGVGAAVGAAAPERAEEVLAAGVDPAVESGAGGAAGATGATVDGAGGAAGATVDGAGGAAAGAASVGGPAPVGGAS